MGVRHTINFAIPVPDFNDPTWHIQYGQAMDLIDTVLSLFDTEDAGILGIWANATDYIVGDRVVDTADAKIYQCLVDNTSGAGPQTFVQYRTANPTHWEQFGLPVARGAWVQNTQYIENDAAYQLTEHLYGVCATSHVSTAVGTMRDDIANWAILADLKSDFDTVEAAAVDTAADAISTAADAAAAAASAVEAAASAVPNGRNVLRMNGGLEVWQRGSGTIHAASTTAYFADRWYLRTVANQASVTDRVTGLVSNSRYAGRVRRNAAQTGTGIMHIGYPMDTDEIIALLGRKVALSFEVKSGANWSPTNGTLTYKVLGGTGAVIKREAGNFTAEVEIISGTIDLTGVVQSVDAVSAATVPTNITQMEVQFQWTPVGAAGAADDFTLDDVQLETVTASAVTGTAFERRLFIEELSLCQTHYYKTFRYDTAPAQNAGTEATLQFYAITATRPPGVAFRFAMPMRKAGYTVTTYNPSAANAQIRNTTTGADWADTIPLATHANQVVITGTPDAGMAAGNGILSHLVADASI